MLSCQHRVSTYTHTLCFDSSINKIQQNQGLQINILLTSDILITCIWWVQPVQSWFSCYYERPINHFFRHLFGVLSAALTPEVQLQSGIAYDFWVFAFINATKSRKFPSSTVKSSFAIIMLAHKATINVSWLRFSAFHNHNNYHSSSSSFENVNKSKWITRVIKFPHQQTLRIQSTLGHCFDQI